MADPEQIYAWAEEAVGREIAKARPDLQYKWRAVAPKNLGLDVDNWLILSQKMIKRFNALAADIPHIWMSEPSRASFHGSPLISFVTAIADLADQIP
ncbi:hypothetical protein ACFB49_34290 [Sphingomonas sp. DBB INV C78]|uniref:hypothetical protein n=1 Tax=Sphingomonas sp. DBB INV C78 TaxID=3349434 RepID=UPI0036D3A77E